MNDMNDMDELDETMECMCDNSFDMAQFFACGAPAVNRSKSPPKLRGAEKLRKTRRQQRAEYFEVAKTAVRLGDLATLSKLVSTQKQANWHAQHRGWSLLDEAVKCASAPMVQWLLDKGANPNTLFFNDQPHAVRLTRQPGWYFSPFATAIQMGHEEITLMLLARGAELSLPVDWLEDGKNITCRDLVEERGMWPCIESYLISQSVGTVVANTREKQRL